jgi:hypothetical protein
MPEVAVRKEAVSGAEMVWLWNEEVKQSLAAHD